MESLSTEVIPNESSNNRELSSEHLAPVNKKSSKLEASCASFIENQWKLTGKYNLILILIFKDSNITSNISSQPLLLKRVDALDSFLAFRTIFSQQFWEQLKVL
jgi:hypothetical protein